MDLQENYEALPTPSPEDLEAFEATGSNEEGTKKGFRFTAEQRAAGTIARAAKITLWETLDTRQEFADERYMRSIISAAGLNAPTRTEPATAKRLKTLLRRKGIQAPEIMEAVGVSADKFLELNHGLPLWAALSGVLEATGKFDKRAAEIVEEDEAITTLQ